MKKRILFIILLLIITLGGYSFYVSKYRLSVSSYEISSSKVTKSIRIMHLSDLHNSSFGKDNEILVAAVKKQNPDIILITGDLVNDKEPTVTSIASKLIIDLIDIAPVYISYGNHEDSLEKSKEVDIYSLYTEAGATVLKDEYIDVNIRQQKIRLGGIYGYCLPDIYAQETYRESESDYLKSFQMTDCLKILLCHMPVGWLESGSLYDWNIDVVFAGHAHGGQICFPFIGGLWAPDQGWFPGKEYGVYTTKKTEWDKHCQDMVKYGEYVGYDVSYYDNLIYEQSYLVLSRGLGSTEKIPRINNIPEIVVVDLVPEEEENAKDK